MLVGREEEFARLETLLTKALSKQNNNSSQKKRKEQSDQQDAIAASPLAIYVSGPPGTGKTETVQAVVKKLNKQRKQFHFVPVDCFASPTAVALAQKILAVRGHRDVPGTQANKELSKLFTTTDRPILLLLDEVDNLLKSKSKYLYTIFGWPAQYNGRIIVIGIANTLDLTERQLPMLKALGTPPELITFSAYTSAQIIAILEQRLATECPDRKAIELCARKVSAVTGDLRQALDFALQMLANLEEEDELAEEDPKKENGKAVDEPQLVLKPSSRTPQKTPIKPNPEEEEEGNMSTPMKLKRANANEGEVTPKRQRGNACREVLKAINKTMTSPCQRSKLPSQARTLLATLMRLITINSSSCSTPSKSPSRSSSVFRTPSKTPNGKNSATVFADSLCVSRDRLFGAYVTVCEHLKLQAPCPDEVDEMLSLLESQSMVKVVRGTAGKGQAAGGQSRVVFMVEMSIAHSQINDNALIADIDQLALL